MSKRRKKLGLAPGSVIFTGSKRVEQVLTHYVQYNADTLVEKVLHSHEQSVVEQPDQAMVDWYDVRGMHDTELIELFGKAFDIHPLILEGVVDIHQRPKFDEYESGNFITLKALSYDKETNQVSKEHVAMYFNDGFIITFQETDTDLFESVRKRVNGSSGRIRQRGADYLAYALADALVDNYYVVLEEMEELIQTLEDKMMVSQDVKDKNKIHNLRKELLVVRKSVAPLREAISRFSKTESTFVSDSSQVFIRDLYEHTIQVMDSIDSHRDILNGLQDLFISEVSFKMNQVMQLLTLISVIFIPLTFLAGIYGMNFEYIPELSYRYGYFVLLGVMLVLFIGLIVFFKRKKWL